MIKEINPLFPPPSLKTLLSYAASSDIDSVYKAYIHNPRRELIGFQKDDLLIGCLGGEHNNDTFIIRHIAVTPEERGNNIGSSMIQFILKSPQVKEVIAETDKDAVDFYRKFGFTITSLGEKYPGVERFDCRYTLM